MKLASVLLALAAAVMASPAPAFDRHAELVALQRRADVSQRLACFMSSRVNATSSSAVPSASATSSALPTSASAQTTSAAQRTTQAPKPQPTTQAAPKPQPTQAPAPKPQPTQAPAPNTGGGSFSARCVNRMNYYRARHGRRALAVDATQTSRAQSWANSCTWSHNSVGQNMWSGTEQDCVAAVDAWYAEIRLLTPGRTYMIDSIWQTVGHLTQMLDTHSTVAGCGVGCKTVCDFDPAGNILGTTFSI
ncbi:hypothetical protein HK105_201577 [Polyrhizophydium stewartii]|uniref:SCP domain-containing protein n=1 Tax=Polyrhizophydium stewartii TaxID=2732419 RepID=A0ABR4NGU1_9FUNG|nr:hypothetical protein HK105_008057 [Polyrhizophydium stewartii]